jgi:hypothetical protein
MTQTAGELVIQSFDTADASTTYDIEVQNTVTLSANGPAGATTFTPISSDKVVFTVAITDGCTAATLNSPSVSTITVEDGKSQTGQFSDASDSFGASLSDTEFCGVRTYEVQDRSTSAVISWVAVANDPGTTNYIITATPLSTTTELQATHALKLVITAPATPTDYTSD